jgi:hypothetical protein
MRLYGGKGLFLNLFSLLRFSFSLMTVVGYSDTQHLTSSKDTPSSPSNLSLGCPPTWPNLCQNHLVYPSQVGWSLTLPESACHLCFVLASGFSWYWARNSPLTYCYMYFTSMYFHEDSAKQMSLSPFCRLENWSSESSSPLEKWDWRSAHKVTLSRIPQRAMGLVILAIARQPVSSWLLFLLQGSASHLIITKSPASSQADSGEASVPGQRHLLSTSMLNSLVGR